MDGENPSLNNQQPAQAGFFSPTENDQAEQQGNLQVDQTEQQGLSFTAQDVEDSISKQFEGDELDDLEQLVTAGNKLLFGKDTHYKLFEEIEGISGEELPMKLAQGGIGITSIMWEKSGGTIPGKIIAPAMTILMARVSEFLNKSGIATVTDEVFEETMHIYSTKLMADNDPEFAKKAGYGQEQPTEPQPGQEQQMPVNSEGLLNTSQGGV